MFYSRLIKKIFGRRIAKKNVLVGCESLDAALHRITLTQCQQKLNNNHYSDTVLYCCVCYKETFCVKSCFFGKWITCSLYLINVIQSMDEFSICLLFLPMHPSSSKNCRDFSTRLLFLVFISEFPACRNQNTSLFNKLFSVKYSSVSNSRIHGLPLPHTQPAEH